jgi:hypothetical protein
VSIRERLPRRVTASARIAPRVAPSGLVRGMTCFS